MSITNKELASVKVLKFNPAVDKEPKYETFSVPYQGLTVLNVLKSIYHAHDAELAFRWGCEGAHDPRCGACVIMVNDKPVLSCRKLAETEMVIEPHPKYKVIKDLVVDFNEVKKDTKKRTPSVQITIDYDKCVKCADCVNLCPAGVYEAKKGEIKPSAEFCCGDTCGQCVMYCQKNAITIKAI